MRHTCVVLATVIVVCLAGCGKRQGKPDKPEKYDPNVDGPPSYVDYRQDDNITADQRKLSADVAAARESANKSAVAQPPKTESRPASQPTTATAPAAARPATATAPAPPTPAPAVPAPTSLPAPPAGGL